MTILAYLNSLQVKPLISFMYRSNNFTYTVLNTVTINRNNIRALNYNHINNDPAHAYFATTTQQSDGNPRHS